MKVLAMTDAVRTLSSRHAFEETLTAEVERARRLGYLLSLIIFDLDFFKEYNDQWGHPARDVHLKSTADLIRSNLHKYDMAARYGGDEFVIIPPNTNQQSALAFARCLHHAAQASAPEPPIEGKGISGFTLSMGIAMFPQDGKMPAGLLLAADQAELMAKRLGKNQIFPAGDLDKKNEQA